MPATVGTAPVLRSGRPRRASWARSGRVERLGLDGVLADVAARGTEGVPVRAADVPGSATGDGLAWADADSDDLTWWPQGVAALRGGDVLLVSWYQRTVRPGGQGWHRWRVPRSRVSVVERSDPARPRYLHVELVVPRRRPLGWVLPPGRVPVHAGGIAVVASPEGLQLLVADTLAGLRVFRLDDATRVGAADDGRWVLPQRLAVRVPLHSLLAGRLRFSFVGVGDVDGEPSLITGEYRRAGASSADGPPRLVRHRLDPTTGLPSGPPVAVHVGQPPRMQGVAVLPGLPGRGPGHGTRWYLSASAGHDTPGDLYVGRPGAWRRVRGALPPGCEDLDPAVPDDPGSVLWGASEHPRRRWVFPVAAP